MVIGDPPRHDEFQRPSKPVTLTVTTVARQCPSNKQPLDIRAGIGRDFKLKASSGIIPWPTWTLRQLETFRFIHVFKLSEIQ